MYLMYILKGLEEILVCLLMLAVLGLRCWAGFPLAAVTGAMLQSPSVGFSLRRPLFSWSRDSRARELRELQHVGSTVLLPGL